MISLQAREGDTVKVSSKNVTAFLNDVWNLLREGTKLKLPQIVKLDNGRKYKLTTSAEVVRID